MKHDVVLPKHLEKLQPLTTDLPKYKHEWMTNEEIARILISFEKHAQWMTGTRLNRPETGIVLMFNRKKVKYRQDLYIWKTKRKTKWPREDHVKLKVNSIPCITAIYVHSDVLPSFHRRCYWLIQNPDVVLVHYLNYPYLDDDAHLTKSLSLNSQSKQWKDLTREEVLQQIRPMLSNLPWPRPGAPSLSQDLSEEMAIQMTNKHFYDLRSQLHKVHGGRRNSDEPRVIRPKIPLSREGKLMTYDGSHYVATGENCVTTTPGKHNGNYVLSPLNNTGAIIIFNQSALPKCLESQPSTLACDGKQKYNGSAANECTTTSIATQHNTCATTSMCPGAVPGSDFERIGQATPPCVDDSSSLSTMENDKRLDFLAVGGDHRSPLRHPEDHLTCTTPQASVLPPSPTPSMVLRTYPQTTATSGETSPFRLALSKDYGVKDMMVPNCNGTWGRPRASPFADDSTVGADLNGLDVFDIESLFNAPKSIKQNSAESTSDQANSSTESAVSDLFPQHFWSTDPKETSPPHMVSDQSNLFMSSSTTEETHDEATETVIMEYSPEWSYTEGGIKVLLTGTWNGPGNYMCCFDSVHVPATVVQSGVLRCYSPAHEAGLVDLYVARDGVVMTHPVKFEYKSPPVPYREVGSHWLQLNEDAFKMSILERLERMEQRLNSMGHTGGSQQSFSSHVTGHQLSRTDAVRPLESSSTEAEDFERRLVTLCQRIHRRYGLEVGSDDVKVHRSEDGLTVLHFAAALGYSTLITSLRSLWMESWNEFLSLECNPAAVDKFDCSPLMWAAATGRLSCVDALYEWLPSCLHFRDVLGRSPAAVATQRRHALVAARLEGLASNGGKLVEGLQEEEDDADISSISESVVSSRVDTIDSGEDSMETDDNTSSAEALRSGAQTSRGAFAEEPASSEHPESVWTTRDPQDNISADLKSTGQPPDSQDGCAGDRVTSLAEQIVEAIPCHCKQGPGDADLTLRSLPYYVTSRCGAQSFREFPHNQTLYRRGIPVVCHMNWSEFLQLPPRESLPDPHYHPSDLDFDSLRLTEHEQRQLYIAARTVLNAYRREFALSKKMNEAAVLIQSKFRSYQEQKRFQRSRHAAILIQSFYRSYKGSRPGQQQHAVRLIEDALRNHMTRRHHQAARKIQRFLRMRSNACSRRHSFNQR